jgi:hypothetical protein
MQKRRRDRPPHHPMGVYEGFPQGAPQEQIGRQLLYSQSFRPAAGIGVGRRRATTSEGGEFPTRQV